MEGGVEGRGYVPLPELHLGANCSSLTLHTAAEPAVRAAVKTLVLRYFTITAEIHARSLVNFYPQYADRHMNLKFM